MKFLMLTAIAGIAFAIGCANPAPPVNVTPSPAPTRAADSHEAEVDNAPRISLADAKKDYDAGSAVVVDVRDPNSYAQEHVKGSINIPLADLATSFDKIPKGKKIVAYCS